MAKSHLTPFERFTEKLVIEANGCWQWTACITDVGYGQISLNGRPVSAHRFAYEHFVGPIPDGLTIDHLCRNRSCVNPTHLEAVTMRENVMRGEGLAARNARRTHCKRGHPFDAENTRITPKGRDCRACAKLHRQKFRMAHLKQEIAA